MFGSAAGKGRRGARPGFSLPNQVANPMSATPADLQDPPSPGPPRRSLAPYLAVVLWLLLCTLVGFYGRMLFQSRVPPGPDPQLILQAIAWRRSQYTPVHDPHVGNHAPAFAVRTAAGQQFGSRDLEGRKAVLVFVG